MTPADSLVGRSLAGRYDVLELLGEGGMGAVYRVLDRELDEIVALKVIRDELASEHEIVERFRNEVKLARRVTHTNVARTFELGHAEGLMYCTMELVDGEALSLMLKRRGRLPLEEAIAIACALCDGLAAAHAVDVVHRDIKPDNVLIASHGRVVLTDFGIATLGVARGETSGTPQYMAPEQARGERPTPAADIYAVGVMLYEMVTGARAFTGSLAEIVAAKQALPHLVATSDHVPAALGDVIVRATARDPEQRIATAAALRAALAPWVEERDTATAARVPVDDPELPVVMVRAPRGDALRQFVAEAVHAELLQCLAQTPRLRVLTHGDGGRRAVVVELAAAGEDLGVTLTAPDRAPLAMRLPLEVGHAKATADAIAGAIVATLTPARDPVAATELLLRARHLARGDFARLGAAVELLEQAHALAPASPQIAATLAAATLQHGFFDPETNDQRMIDRARELVSFALAAGPAHYETHLAAGQLEYHVGEPANAAGHFRLAIACAPHEALAHEQLGRMLLEAGYLDAGFARLDEALALAPELRSARWQIARAYALEDRWAEAEEMVAPLVDHEDSVGGRMRVACWRGDLDEVRALRGREQAPRLFAPELFEAMLAVACDGNWLAVRDRMRAIAADPSRLSRRHRAFLAQLVAEMAGMAGDDACAEDMVRRACADGLFDLHWLDRVPPLAGLRGRPAFALLRAEVKRRADAILDALYGDHPIQPPARTEVSPLPTRFEAGSRLRTVKW